MNNINVVKAVEYVNKIVETVRCATCDKLEGSRVRYPCGHTGCDDCVVYTECCPTCSPPRTDDAAARPDHPWTQTVKNATTLLETCHKLFDPEAFQHKKLSEQLKIEKELFPQCIQAPLKYENRRKSTKFSLDNKENRYSTIFPGETVSFSKDNRMENSATYVQQWLNRNEKKSPRKPFADLNVNTQRINNSKNKNLVQNIKQNEQTFKSNRKRSNKFIARDSSLIYDSKKSTYECDITPKKVKKELSNITDVQKLGDNDESGIFMDEPIVIDDTQDTPADKDKQAWLAVLEAHEKEHVQSTSLSTADQNKNAVDSPKQIISNTYDIDKNKFNKVPFYKRSAIYNSCRLSDNEVNTEHISLTKATKPVVITVDSDTFVTTVTVIKNVQSKKNKSTNSVSIQTDTKYTNFLTNVNKEHIEIDKCPSNIESDAMSEDLFADDKKIVEEVVGRQEMSKGIVIEESDSDTDLEVSGPMSVQADVHRSCEELEYGILTDIINVKEHESKSRRAPRGHTPTSTDSSEKENYNPNRMRRHTSAKKKPVKK